MYVNDLQAIIKFKYPGANFTCGDTYESINWDYANSFAKPSSVELDAADTEYTAVKLKQAPKELRRVMYDQRGATHDALIIALWERIVEGRPEKADKIQLIREAVKTEVPLT